MPNTTITTGNVHRCSLNSFICRRSTEVIGAPYLNEFFIWAREKSFGKCTVASNSCFPAFLFSSPFRRPPFVFPNYNFLDGQKNTTEKVRTQRYQKWIHHMSTRLHFLLSQPKIAPPHEFPLRGNAREEERRFWKIKKGEENPFLSFYCLGKESDFFPAPCPISHDCALGADPLEQDPPEAVAERRGGDLPPPLDLLGSQEATGLVSSGKLPVKIRKYRKTITFPNEKINKWIFYFKTLNVNCLRTIIRIII